jgi:glycosyltransferase involved in cell wall biosynthesis
MRVLIISSEELYENNVMPSVFELAQAKALKQQNIDVTILVVNVPYTYMGLLRRILFQLVGIKNHNLKYEKPLKTLIFQFLKRSLTYILGRKKNKNKVDIIEGIEIYSTTIIPFTSTYTVETFIARWENSALSLFQLYTQKRGGLPDIIHAHSRFLYAGHFAYTLKLKYAIKYILTEHSSYYITVSFSLQVVQYIQQMIGGASKYLLVSESMAPHIKKKSGIEQLQYEILPNVIDEIFEQYTLQPKPENQSPLYIINIASFHEIKNHRLLLKSFAKSFKNRKDIKLKLVGGGLEERLKPLCVEEGIIDQVIFVGKINTKEAIINELDKSLFFTLSSNLETFGVVVIEALSRGLPVVSTRCGGPESIIDSTNGILVNGTVEEMSEGLSKMMDTYISYNPNVIRNNVIQKYGNHAISKKLITFYE